MSSDNEQPSDGKPYEHRFNPFVSYGDTLELGRKLDLREVFTRYLRPHMEQQGRKRKTINGLDRHLRLWEQWWFEELEMWRGRAQLEFEKAVVAKLTIQHLQAYQGWLVAKGRAPLFVNQSVSTIRQILRCAVRHGLITHAPSVQGLPAQKAAPKIYLVDDHLTTLWRTPPTDWPMKDRNFRRLHYPPELGWRCCLTLWVLYGFRTQELIALESKSKPITWSCIHDTYGMETPNPEGNLHNEWGWLAYVPPKQSWCKPQTLYLPLNTHARAALEHLRPPDWTPEQAVCNWTFSSTSFYKTWHAWLARGGISPKVGKRFVVKHLRKTCSTRVKTHAPGLSKYITGHSSDRSGTDAVSTSHSDVSEQHYENSETAVLKCMTTIPLPPCFDEILSCPVQRVTQ